MASTKLDSHWVRTAVQPPKAERMIADITVDSAIVGGGLTGTRAALGLAEAGQSVAVLDAQHIGFGASGRSGGQCNPMWRATPNELAKKIGDGCAARLIDTTLEAANALFFDIERYGIDCDAEQTGWVQAAHCGSTGRDLQRLADAWNDVGGQIEMLDSAETAAATGSKEYRFSLFHPTGGHVQPLSLTRGFAKQAVAFGARLFDASPVQHMERVGDIWHLTTPGGTVKANQVILATNAYTDGLWPNLRQTVMPMVSICLVTAPLTADMLRTVLPNAVTLSDTRRAIYYCRFDRDRRLIFGCIGSGDDPALLGGKTRLRKGLNRVFPRLSTLPIERYWAGRIAVTSDLMPHLHEPAPGVLAGLGFSGRGIAMTSVMARALVQKALGARDDELPFPVLPISPMPLHAVGSALIPFGAVALSVRDKLDGVLGH